MQLVRSMCTLLLQMLISYIVFFVMHTQLPGPGVLKTEVSAWVERDLTYWIR